MKWRPCWCPKPVLKGLNSFLMPTLSFVPINFHRCWPRGWKRSIRHFHISHNAHHLPPVQILHNLCLSFLPVLQPSQGKLKTMLIQNVWGANNVIMGNVEVAYGRIALAVATILDKSPGPYCNIHIFLCFLGSLLKQCILFEIFLQFFFAPSYTKLKLWIHASKIVCGVRGVGGGGVGPLWIGNWNWNHYMFSFVCTFGALDRD